MVLSLVADELTFEYVLKAAKESTAFSLGLILGQKCGDKCYVTHFATSSNHFLFAESDGEEGNVKHNLASVNEHGVTDHAGAVIMGLSGGMSVLGLYITSSENILNPFNNKVKSILKALREEELAGRFWYGSNSEDKVVLFHDTKTKQSVCKVYDCKTSSIKPAEFKILPTPIKWKCVEFFYEITEVSFSDRPWDKSFALMIRDVKTKVNSSVCLFMDQLRIDEDTLEILETTKRKSALDFQPIDAIVLGPKGHLKDNILDSRTLFIIGKSHGLFMLDGRISCQIWLHPKTTFKDATLAVKEDIMRSLVARITLHLDDNLDNKLKFEEKKCYSLPRRVFIKAPNTGVSFTDYIFADTDQPMDRIKETLTEIFGMDIKGKVEYTEQEGKFGQYPLKHYDGQVCSDPSRESVKTTFLIFYSLLIAFIAVSAYAFYNAFLTL